MQEYERSRKNIRRIWRRELHPISQCELTRWWIWNAFKTKKKAPGRTWEIIKFTERKYLGYQGLEDLVRNPTNWGS